MRTVVILAVIGLVLEALRLSLLARFPAHPDLLLGVVVLFALGRSSAVGAVTGFALGALRDLVYGQPLGVEAVPMAVIGWGVASLGNTVYREAFITRGVVLFVAALGKGLVNYLVSQGGSGSGVVFYLFLILIPSAALTAIVVPAGYALLRGPVWRNMQFVARYTHAWVRGYEKKVLDKQQ